ncbi:hypothetical protein [Natrinema soli]|uniref:Halobacterial output domain-containing protein n=1 Tax=Natrinema soli TaxID=1930624 RepID=A0ABD5SIX4_9EURY
MDPEMMNDLCESQQDGSVKFVYSGFHITVENGNYLALREERRFGIPSLTTTEPEANSI